MPGCPPLSLEVAGEPAMLAFGARLGRLTQGRGLIFLRGDLGAGKTTLARGLLQGLGYQGKVKSPTYTLMELYERGEGHILHLDLYRLAAPEELEFLAIRDYCSETTLCLVEWPERAGGFFSKPDLEIDIGIRAQSRMLNLSPGSERAWAWCSALTGGV